MGRKFTKVAFASDPASQMQRGGKGNLLVEKRNLSDLGWIISTKRRNAENCGKSVNGRPRSFGAFVPSSDSGTML